MNKLRLPTMPAGLTSSHDDYHAKLKAEYDTRHPDAPLPTLGADNHSEVHNLLHADYNELSRADPPKRSGDLATGHLAHHNALAAAYNARIVEREKVPPPS